MQNRLPSTSLLSLAFYFAVICGTVQADDPPVTLRVLTYNIHHGEGVDGKLDLNRIAQVITDCKPDLVALQEVDREVRRSGSQQQPEVLAQLTGLQQAFGKNLDIQGGGYGNCVLSRFPISSARNHSLPNIGSGEPRGVLEVTVTVPGLPDELHILATHFDHRPDETNRLAAVKWIEDFCGNSQKPLLLAGDLNCTPESETIRLLGQRWQFDSESKLLTFPAQRPKQQIDYVMAGPVGSWKIVETRVVEEPTASDHRPLLTVLEWVSSPESSNTEPPRHGEIQGD